MLFYFSKYTIVKIIKINLIGYIYAKSFLFQTKLRINDVIVLLKINKSIIIF